MSLRETLAGAKEEVAQGGNPFEHTKMKEKTDEQEASASGFSKRSMARAKPRREAASGVRVVSADDYKYGDDGKTAAEMTKEQRKEKRQRQRAADNLRVDAQHAILKGHDSYKRSQRTWWVLLGVGVGMTLLSWAVSSWLNGGSPDYNNPIGILSVVLLVVAYGFVIGAFVYDWRVVRPMRKAAEIEVAGMSDKRVRQYMAAQEDERAHEQSEKDKARNNAYRLKRHEQHK